MKKMLISVFVLLVMVNIGFAGVICEEKSNFTSEEYGLKFSGYSVSADTIPVIREQQVNVIYTVENIGVANITFTTDGIGAKGEDPDGVKWLFGEVLADPSPPLEPGQSTMIIGEKIVSLNGTWRFWPHFFIKKNGTDTVYYMTDPYWHECVVDVLWAPDNTKPTVSVSHFPDVIEAGDSLRIDAIAADDYRLDYVEILLDGVVVETCQDSPCTYINNNIKAGVYRYTATAYDTSGNMASTDGVVEVSVPDVGGPIADINHEPFGVSVGDLVTFTATAEDLSGVERIEIFVNGFEVHECFSDICVYTNDTFEANQLVNYLVRAYDIKGNMAQTQPKNFMVLPEDRESPEVLIEASKFNPTVLEKITFTATATDDSGIDKIDILINSEVVETCYGAETCEYIGGPYGDYANGSQVVNYTARAFDIFNNTDTTGYQNIFVGRYNRKCQPLNITGPSWQKIDILFVPDFEYGGDFQRFVVDLEQLIRNSYGGSGALKGDLDKFNFHYYRELGNASMTLFDPNVTRAGDEYTKCSPQPLLSDYKLDCGFDPETIPIIHITDCRDYARRSPAMFTSEFDSFSTAVHESGHAIFGLVDEYCCDSVYRFKEPEKFPNVWNSSANCRSYARSKGWETNGCKLIGNSYPTEAQCKLDANVLGGWRGRASWCTKVGSVWTPRNVWRVDSSPDIMVGGSRVVQPFGKSDVLRINYIFSFYERLANFNNMMDAVRSGITQAFGGVIRES